MTADFGKLAATEQTAFEPQTLFLYDFTNLEANLTLWFLVVVPW